MNAAPLVEVAGEVLARIAASEYVFGFLDFDGTLAAIAPTPEEARPLPGVATVLRALAHAPGTSIAIVSGRPIADLRCLLDVEGAYYVGVHGLELQAPGGAVKVAEASAIAAAALPGIRAALEESLGGREGVLFEDKGASLAVHYRLASRADAAEARRKVIEVATATRGQGVEIAVREGHEVSEILPAVASKATAVRALLKQVGRDVAPLPIAIGDDQSDEDVFAALPPPAVTVRVGGPETATSARFLLPGPEAVVELLGDVLRARAALRAANR